MKLVFNKIGRFIFLRLLLGVVVVIGLVYLEEDWRGAQQLAATKAEWAAKGESFDRAKFVPPPVPDEQNLAALPLFKLEPVVDTNGEPYLTLVTLNKAMREGPPANEIPNVGKWSMGELPDLPKIGAAVASNYTSIFKDAKPPASTLAQFEAIYPFLAELRTASASRPQFRLNLDYMIDPPDKRPLGPVVGPLRISKLLAVHAILALHEHQADLALADLQLNHQLFLGTRRDPSLVGNLVAIGMRAIANTAIHDGLAEHLWSDTQLIKIDAMLKQTDFLADYRFAMRSELLFSLGNLDYIRQPSHRSTRAAAESAHSRDNLNFFDLFADGWWGDNESQIAIYYFHELTAVDPKARRVYPDVATLFKVRTDEACTSWDAMAPWNMFFTMLVPGTSMAVEKFAEAQVSVDETRIACALERYHLAHGSYPESLEALAPSYLNEVPHDVMNGQPYHYQLRGDGTFLLYSVGWNQSDDGGKTVFMPHDEKTIDYENGDWVWPTPKAAH